jgi:aspartate/methionine/tyrosine aminotransferase
MTGRLAGIPGFGIDRVAAAAGDDPGVLRMENLDTDVPPPAAAVEATRRAVGEDDANSYLPFTGTRALREAVAGHVGRGTGLAYDPDTEVVITCGGMEGLFDAVLAVTEAGDEVVLTDPTYAGMVNRVRLAGGEPRLAPLHVEGGEWRLDPDDLRAATGPRARALMLMSPSMPSGAVLDRAAWEAAADLCRAGRWLVYNAAMERILFDGRRPVAAAALPGMRERTLVVGSVSKELRMIGWRIGWVVGPAAVMADVAKAHIYNVVTPTGLTQSGAAAALALPPADVEGAVAEWQRRRDVVLAELDGLPVVRPGGGWSLLLDVTALGLSPAEASERLLRIGRVAATPMTGWGGAVADRHVRFVYSNEPVERLRGMGERVRRSLA